MPYDQFLALNDELKELCGRWQLRDGAPNDHADQRYDAAVIADLDALHDRAVPVVRALGLALAAPGALRAAVGRGVPAVPRR